MTSFMKILKIKYYDNKIELDWNYTTLNIKFTREYIVVAIVVTFITRFIVIIVVSTIVHIIYRFTM